MDLNMLSAISKYGPGIQSPIRRSQYLSDALQALQQSGDKIQSLPELGTKLLATAIMSRSQNKNDQALIKALTDAQTSAAQPTLDWIKSSQAPAAPIAPTAPAPDVAPQPPPPSPQPTSGILGMNITPPTIQKVESNDNPNAVSSAGARGLMQLMPQTAANPGFGIAPARDASPAENQRVGSDYYQALVQKYGGNQVYANVAYNWGPGNADRWIAGGAHLGALPRETRDHLVKLAIAASAGSGQGTPTLPAPQGAPQTPSPPSTPDVPQTPSPRSQGPTTAEVKLFQDLYANPMTRDEALSYGMKLRQHYAEPTTYQTQMINGVPAWLDPSQPGSMHLGQVPQGAQTQTVPTPEGYVPGSVVQRSPTGAENVVQAPQPGFMGSPRRQQPIPGGSQDPAGPANIVGNEEKLRDDYNRSIQGYISAREGYQKVIQAARTATPAGDIALVFGYMKTLDPNSTVREGEQATVQNSGTVPQTISNMYNRMIQGTGRLTPDQRQQFVQAAGQQFEVYQRTKDQADQRYGGMARSYGFDPSRVVQTLPAIDASQQAPGSGPNGMTQEQIQAAQKYRGQQGETPLVPTTQQQYDHIPKGRMFIDKSGKVRVKQ